MGAPGRIRPARAERDARVGVLFTTLEDDPETGWTIELAPFLGSRSGPIGPIDVLYLVVDPSGRLTDLRGPKGAHRARTEAMANSHWHLVLPALLAVCFLHCRNVSHRVVVPDARLNRARARRGRRPFLRYKLLRIVSR